jgi:hypothetical protein
MLQKRRKQNRISQRAARQRSKEAKGRLEVTVAENQVLRHALAGLLDRLSEIQSEIQDLLAHQPVSLGSSPMSSSSGETQDDEQPLGQKRKDDSLENLLSQNE